MGTASEKWNEKYAWLIIFIFGLLCAVAAPINLLGTPPNPPSPEATTGLTLGEMDDRIPGMRNYIAGISTQMGNFLLAMGVLLMGIGVVPFRKGEKWAWFVSWTIPLTLVIQLANSRGGLGWQADLGALVVILAGLFMPFRKFFPWRPQLTEGNAV